jgi:hypothetical protein
MSTHRVYHPVTGEPFDVSQSKMTDLVLNHNWSQTPPEAAAQPAPIKPKRSRRAKEEAVEALAPEAVADDASEPHDEAASEDDAS